MVTGSTAEALKKRKHGKSHRWSRLRLAVQVLFFLLFISLLLATRQESTQPFHSFFFRLDPLVGISAMLGGRSWIPAMLVPGAIILLLTLLLGRVWCSWICPLGSILEWVPARRPRRNILDLHPYWRQAKNFLLFIILLGALLGSLTLVFLDPVTLLFRTVTSAILPALDYIIETVEAWLYQAAPLRGAVGWFDSLLRGWLLNDIPFYLPNLAVLVAFGAVLALNAIYPRFWCRYLCPLGGLLGLVCRAPFVHYRVDREKCISCQRCATVCPTAAISPENEFTANSPECITCLDCLETCPTGAIAFTGAWGLSRVPGYDPSRRHLLASLGAAIIGTVVLRFIPSSDKAQSILIRPPGASENSLLTQCVRCGECMKICPTSVIQPGYQAQDWEALWTPMLVTRLGYCDYSCNSCGKICPTGAITSLSLADKRQAVIGVARIDRKRCIPWSEGRECIVCEEMCPVPQKAINLDGQGRGYGGNRVDSVGLPQVREHLCTGCGICEYQCPVNGEAAIRIIPVDQVTL